MESFRTGTVLTTDGVRLRAYDRPGPGDDAPVILLSNGLGGNLDVWRHFVARFSDTHRLVSWDYRGLYGSALTEEQADPYGGVALDIEAHVADALAVLDHFEVERAVLVGWSMGVQLNFEVAREHEDRAEAIIALSGGYGKTLKTTVVGARGEPFLIPAMEGMRFVVENFASPLKSLLRQPRVLGVAKRVGFIAPSLDESIFTDLVGEYLDLDFKIYNRILAALGDHDAEDVLPTLGVPVLVIAGDRDPMTPAWLSKRMVEIIPTAELLILPGGSHYAPVEFPDRINDRAASFLRQHLPRSAD